MKYHAAFQKMLKNEGGFRHTNIMNDLGGETYAGISRKNFPDWVGWEKIDKRVQRKFQLEDDVKDFYLNEFWYKLGCDQINDCSLRFLLFDIGINMGKKVVGKILQSALYRYSDEVGGLIIDGIIGKKTIGVISSLHPETETEIVFNDVRWAILNRYLDICTGNPSQKKFLLGWARRISRHKITGDQAIPFRTKGGLS